MRRLPPSALVREEIDRLLSGGVERGGNIVSELASLGLRYLAQQGLEQEQHDHLGRGRYERRAGGEEPGWRNGYEDARIRTAEGAVTVRVPQVRAHARAVRDAPTLDAGEAMAASLIGRFGDAHPSAVACFSDDLEASLAHLRLPARHRINVRTTNLIERSFVEERSGCSGESSAWIHRRPTRERR